ncbi:LRR receptor-like serine/threonine-protein kinase [Olea europaea var. sylvestris]|uniref:LRR receptor-like serine/threonine-protein kinase n=1 Tax=Olea europaea var. sylvestris TaxID=158386 RepID=UPI000C1D018D|nr:LRR receptor-like serine/threonine-protein kinase [Olea europaea var. sylvestris]
MEFIPKINLLELGSIVDQLDFASLSNLTNFDLYSNNSYGLIAYQIGDLKNLTSLDLSFNSFLVESPKSLFTNPGKLEYLDHTCYHIHGTLQFILAKMGNILSSIGKLENLEILGHTINSLLNSTIPSKLILCTILANLSLIRNLLTESLPLSLTNPTKLSFSFIFDSNLSNITLILLAISEVGQGSYATPRESIPKVNLLELGGTLDQPNFVSLSNLTSKLEYLDLRVTIFSFSRSIPDILGMMPNLEILELTLFQGNILSSIGKLENLEFLDLTINSPLNSTILSKLILYTNLTNSSLSRNLVMESDQVILFVHLSSKLEYLDLMCNYIQGTLQLIIAKMEKLKGLSLNSFSRSIPDILGLMPNLEILELTLFQGNILSSIGKLENFEFLDLTINSLLNSTILSKLILCTNLAHSSLSRNLLMESLPLSLTNLTKLSFSFIFDSNLSRNLTIDSCQDGKIERRYR